MAPGYLKMLGSLLEVREAAVAAVVAVSSRCQVAAGSSQPVDGCARIGALTLLAELDFARGRRRHD